MHDPVVMTFRSSTFGSTEVRAGHSSRVGLHGRHGRRHDKHCWQRDLPPPRPHHTANHQQAYLLFSHQLHTRQLNDPHIEENMPSAEFKFWLEFSKHFAKWNVSCSLKKKRIKKNTTFSLITMTALHSCPVVIYPPFVSTHILFRLLLCSQSCMFFSRKASAKYLHGGKWSPSMLTYFTVSVVLLYGVVLGEANPSHPFYAFWRGQSGNLQDTEWQSFWLKSGS